LRSDIHARSATGRLPLNELKSTKENKVDVSGSRNPTAKNAVLTSPGNNGYTDTWCTHQVKEELFRSYYTRLSEAVQSVDC
jgi:hypothetical protein